MFGWFGWQTHSGQQMWLPRQPCSLSGREFPLYQGQVPGDSNTVWSNGGKVNVLWSTRRGCGERGGECMGNIEPAMAQFE